MDMKVEVYENRKTTQIKHDRAPTFLISKT